MDRRQLESARTLVLAALARLVSYKQRREQGHWETTCSRRAISRCQKILPQNEVAKQVQEGSSVHSLRLEFLEKAYASNSCQPKT